MNQSEDMKTINPTISECIKSGKPCLKFLFKGLLQEKDALLAIEEWKAYFQSKPMEKIVLIWECQEMKGYDTASRTAWQNTLNELKPQIENIWLITTSKLIKLGAQIMSVFTSLNIKVVESEEQIVV